MSKRLRQAGILIFIFTFLGCSSTGITTRGYVEDKDRVDQEMSGGNFGYISGQPKAEDRAEYKKTRKIYVLEFTKEVEQPEDEPLVITRTKVETVPVETTRKAPLPQWAQPVQIPSLEDDMGPGESVEGAMVDYEVQKGDTLQKISKKFYDTYRKWPQILEANKDVLKDPNRIKPGMVLRIPTE